MNANAAAASLYAPASFSHSITHATRFVSAFSAGLGSGASTWSETSFDHIRMKLFTAGGSRLVTPPAFSNAVCAVAWKPASSEIAAMRSSKM